MASTSTPAGCVTATATYTLVIICGIFNFTTTSGLALSTTTSTDYSEQLVGSGGLLPYTFTLTGGTLPGNMTLSSTGLLKGMPTSTGSVSLTIQLKDYNGCTSSVTRTLSVTCGYYALPDSLPDADTSSSYDVFFVAPGIYFRLGFSALQTELMMRYCS